MTYPGDWQGPPRPVACEEGRGERRRVVFRVFCALRPGFGIGAWLMPGGKRWWRNDSAGVRPRFASFGTEAAARQAIEFAPPIPWTD